MNIWVDADACPAVIKNILFRAANRTQTPLILVLNHSISIPPSPFIRIVRVPPGFDVADHYIVDHISIGDLAITADLPLAALVVAKGAKALNPRGELYTESNIQQRLGFRDRMTELRNAGLITSRTPTFGNKEKIAFANVLDKILASKNKS